MALQPFGPSPPFRFLNPIHSRYSSLDGGWARRKGTQISVPRMGFETKIPVFEQAKTVHDLDRAVTAVGWSLQPQIQNIYRLINRKTILDYNMFPSLLHRKTSKAWLGMYIYFRILSQPKYKVFSEQKNWGIPSCYGNWVYIIHEHSNKVFCASVRKYFIKKSHFQKISMRWMKGK
jgi:hypothetical protein